MKAIKTILKLSFIIPVICFAIYIVICIIFGVWAIYAENKYYSQYEETGVYDKNKEQLTVENKTYYLVNSVADSAFRYVLDENYGRAGNMLLYYLKFDEEHKYMIGETRENTYLFSTSNHLMETGEISGVYVNDILYEAKDLIENIKEVCSNLDKNKKFSETQISEQGDIQLSFRFCYEGERIGIVDSTMRLVKFHNGLWYFFTESKFEKTNSENWEYYYYGQEIEEPNLLISFLKVS